MPPSPGNQALLVDYEGTIASEEPPNKAGLFPGRGGMEEVGTLKFA